MARSGSGGSITGLSVGLEETQARERAGVGSPHPRAQKIRVGIVSDVELHARGLQHIIDSTHCAETVGVVVPVSRAIFHLRSMQPEVVLIDADREQTVAVTLTIRHEMPNMRVVAITAKAGDSAVVRFAKAGVVGFVHSDSSPRELEDALRFVTEHGFCCPHSVTKVLLHYLSSERIDHLVDQRLTRREREILSLVARGLSNKELAERLCIEVATAKNHVHNILEKLNVATRREAARLWSESGSTVLRPEAVAWGD